MLNTAIAESVMLEKKIVVVVLDNRGFGCIHRLQAACGGDEFNNLFSGPLAEAPRVDFAAHAKALGAEAELVPDLEGLAAALDRARASSRTYVIAIETDAEKSTTIGGAWWDVAVPEVSDSEAVRAARRAYEEAIRKRDGGSS
jgi:3D-(3,5/4)-trihydroxycyclohexane-1,2-dione acylhydrolase (decyclizing)